MRIHLRLQPRRTPQEPIPVVLVELERRVIRSIERADLAIAAAVDGFGEACGFAQVDDERVEVVAPIGYGLVLAVEAVYCVVVDGVGLDVEGAGDVAAGTALEVGELTARAGAERDDFYIGDGEGGSEEESCGGESGGLHCVYGVEVADMCEVVDSKTMVEWWSGRGLRDGVDEAMVWKGEVFLNDC